MTALVFSPGQRIMVSAVGFDIDGTDTIWDVTDPARPRSLATFEGGAPTAISPDGRTVATLSFHDQPVLWNVAAPARAARIATLGGHTGPVAAVAFSPDGHLLADVGNDGAVTVFKLTDPAHPARTATKRTVAAALMADGSVDYSDTKYALAFSADGHTLTAIADSTAPAPGPPTTAGQTISR